MHILGWLSHIEFLKPVLVRGIYTTIPSNVVWWIKQDKYDVTVKVRKFYKKWVSTSFRKAQVQIEQKYSICVAIKPSDFYISS